MHAPLFKFGLISSLILAASSASALNTPDKMFALAEDCSLPGVQMNCVLWKPANYNPATKYPLIVYMHGAGQSGWSADAGANIEIIRNTQNWAAMLATVVGEETGTTNGEYLVMMPQAPNPDTMPGGGAYVEWDWGQSQSYSLTLPESQTMKNARAMIESVRGASSIDADRIYVIGASMGGFGAWDAAARYPGVFAATMPNAGGGPPDSAPLLKNMAIWSHHNDGDGNVPVGSDREMFFAVAKAGGRPVYTETVLANHTDGGVSGNPNFMSWMLAQRRGVPAATNPSLAFDPPGGALTSPVNVTLSSDQGGSIRYTLDGTMPSPNSGMVYNGPIALTDSVVLIAMADNGGQKFFHAAPFQVDGKPLPAGAELVDGPAPPLPDPPATGGSANAGTGGSASNPGAGGTSNTTGNTTSGGSGSSPFPKTGGASNTTPTPTTTGTASTPVPGTTSTTPGSTPPTQGGGSVRQSSSACSVGSIGSEQRSALALLGLALAGLAVSRRKPR